MDPPTQNWASRWVSDVSHALWSTPSDACRLEHLSHEDSDIPVQLYQQYLYPNPLSNAYLLASVRITCVGPGSRSGPRSVSMSHYLYLTNPFRNKTCYLVSAHTTYQKKHPSASFKWTRMDLDDSCAVKFSSTLISCKSSARQSSICLIYLLICWPHNSR